MIQLTKIFHFEMAHAIDGYPGACKNIHGHSYELHVQVNSGNQSNEYIEGIGLAIDFKDIKNIIKGYGDKIQDMVTLNLPHNNLTMIARLMYSFGLLASFPL